ncbi:unnamed protein product [Polarella glacialis]|uniref:C3H1-type domain-containing protein n=1 Tax=Polarella glacialis TaxID=89957 RepID=A0A813FNN3_POLGL|nr:unnamed protein product [Polarella glacialis]
MAAASVDAGATHKNNSNVCKDSGATISTATTNIYNNTSGAAGTTGKTRLPGDSDAAVRTFADFLRHDSEEDASSWRSESASSSESSEASEGSSAADPAELAALRASVLLDDDGNHTSLGSFNHRSSECSPCVFHNLNGSCSLGIRCQYCHFPHVIDRTRLRRLRPVPRAV